MIPHRFVVKRPTAHEVRAFCELCDELENAVLSKGNVELLLARWNQRANRVFAPHEFAQYSGAMGTRDFVLMALTPKPQHVADLTWAEAVAVFDVVATDTLEAWELDFFKDWLELQFPDANVSDLLFWPDSWFGVDEALQFPFTAQHFATAAMRRSGRQLPGAQPVELPFPVG
ncbi:MAG: hypothetical protein Q8S33_25960 [Myxococcales bacterium]|nr:hypothetical protein [Myxococcales bacterium]